MQLGGGTAAPIVDPGAPGQPEPAAFVTMQQRLSQRGGGGAKRDRLERTAVVAGCHHAHMILANRLAFYQPNRADRHTRAGPADPERTSGIQRGHQFGGQPARRQ